MRMTGKPGYQETDIGWIPADWSVTTLGTVGRCIRGVSYKPEHLHAEPSDSTVTLLRSNNIRNGRVNFNEIQLVSNENVSAVQLIKAFDIAICMSNGSKPLVGKSGVVKPEHMTTQPRLTVGAFCSIYRSEYAYPAHVFQSSYYQSSIDIQLSGSAINNLKGSDIEGIKFPWPPLPEQQKIAAILTAVDDKLDVIAGQIAATQTIKQGMMQILFSRGAGTQGSDGRWVPHAIFKDSELGKIPATWNAKSLVELAQESRKRNSGSLDDNLLCGVLKSQGLVPMRERVKGVSTERCRIVEPDAFAYNPMRINIGSIARNLSQRTVMVSPDYVVFAPIPSLLSADFLDHFRKSDGWTRFVGQSGDGGVRIRIYFEHLSHVLIPTPPMPEQKRIAEILNSIDAKVKALVDKQTYYQTLKRGLMQKLLTGEWRTKFNDVALVD